jgi:hypothetical protein
VENVVRELSIREKMVKYGKERRGEGKMTLSKILHISSCNIFIGLLDKTMHILVVETQILIPEMHGEAENEGYTMNL